MFLGITVDWTKVEVETPLLSRSSHGVSVISAPGKSTVYVFGGEHVARNAIDNKMLALDLSADKPSWKTLECKGQAPVERFAHCQTVIEVDGESYIYIFGGRQGVEMGEKALNDMHRFNTATNEWSAVDYSSGVPPSQRSFHGSCSHNHMLYVFGGCDNHHGRCNDLYSFDTKSRIWQSLPASDKISGRGGSTLRCSADGKAIFVISGFSGQENGDVHKFDIASGSWTTVVNDDFRPRSVCSSATLPLPNAPFGPEGVIVLFGGEVDISAKGHEGAGEFARDVVGFSGASGLTMPVQDISRSTPPCRGWASATAIGEDQLVLVGGLTGSDADPIRLDDIWMLKVTKTSEAEKKQ